MLLEKPAGYAVLLTIREFSPCAWCSRFWSGDIVHEMDNVFMRSEVNASNESN